MKTNNSSMAIMVLLLWGTVVSLPAQVPSTISYQGRLQASGTNFNGIGLFKFALVNPGTNAARRATASAVVNSGFITSYVVTDGGWGYTTAPGPSTTFIFLH